MSAFPMPDVSNNWGYHPRVPTSSVAAYPGSNPNIPMHLNGYSYMGATTPLAQQPRRHFPTTTPVLGNYIGNSAENDLSLDPYVSKFSPTTQWQMTGKSYVGDNDPYSSPDNIDNGNKNFYDPSANKGQLMQLPDPKMQVQLCDKELWDQFSKAGTEMIVTKTGRRMFPGYRIKLSGLDRDAKYCVMMDIVNVDDHRYKFQHGEWTIAGRGEPHLPQRFFLHPDSPASGAKWMSEIVSFHKVKLTNSVGRDVDGKIVLNSMHRYQPRIHIVRTNDASRVHMQRLCTFAFPQTVFITVTAYQNPEVTKLKIDNNPFAKGFREDGARAKKPRTPPGQYSDGFHQTFADAKRPAYELRYRQTPLQHTPVMATPVSRLGFDNGASPELNNVRPINDAFCQLQQTNFSDEYLPNIHNNYSQNITNTTYPEYWKSFKSGQNSYKSPEMFSHQRQNLQMNQNHHTTVILANNLSISQSTPMLPDSVNPPQFNLSPKGNDMLNEATPSLEQPFHSPQNLEDIIEKAGHEMLSCQNSQSDAVVRSSDSGIGSSPSTMSDEDNMQAHSAPATFNESTNSEIIDVEELQSATQTSIVLADENSNNKSYEETPSESPHSVQNLQDVKSHIEENSSTDYVSTSSNRPIQNSYPVNTFVPNTPHGNVQHQESVFSFGQDTFHRAFTSDFNEADDAINWETGLVKM